MSAYCGWVGVGAADTARSTVETMLARESGRGDLQLRSGEGWALATRSADTAAGIGRQGETEYLLLGRPGVGQGPGPQADLDGPGCVALWDAGVEGFSAINGKFAFVGIDAASGSLRAVVDRFGVIALYFARAGEGIVFASSPRAVARHPAVSASLSSQAIYDYLYATVVPGPATIYQAVRALGSGTALEVRDGNVVERRYWQPRFAADGPSRVGSAAEKDIHRLMREGVSRSARHGRAPGCFLSGGIDSSTIVGCLAEVTGERPRTFSIGFDVPGYDELSYARIVAKRVAAEHHEYYVTPTDVGQIMERAATAFGQPFGNSSIIPAFVCGRLAREAGVDCLLAGDGGDELFGGNERYAQQWLFDLYRGLPPAVRRLSESFERSAGAALRRVPVARKAMSYIRYAAMPLPNRLDIFNYLNVLGRDRIFDAGFLAAIDVQAAVEQRRRLYEGSQATSTLDRLLALDFTVTLTDNDLPKVTTMCEQAGVGVEFPFLDRDVVDFSCSLPARDKVRRTELRYFFKKAMADFLPREVIDKGKHGFGLPFGIWVNEHPELRERAFDLLRDARSRSIFRSAFIDDLMQDLIPGNPRYYGPFVWLIIVLESWMQENT